MKRKKIKLILPYLLTVIVLIYTWSIIVTTDYYATLKHQIALILALINLGAYFFKFDYGVMFTGILLLLATFNLIALFPDIVSSSYFIRIAGKQISTPTIQGRSLLLMIIFLVINSGYLIEVYANYKYAKKNNDHGEGRSL
ncbi:MAG: hypothetical protein IT249_00945 [Chitinophagaceae bacterium]|nr:hypothetical protein [Chitinophagaceae bacterium]